MEEVWKNINGYEDKYKVSNLGRVKSLKDAWGNYREKILKQSNNKDGYKMVGIRKCGKTKTHQVHRLVALAFIPNPNNCPVVNHKDETRDNNNVDNLEWCTCKYNSNYGTRTERYIKSKRNKSTRKIFKRGTELVVTLPMTVIKALNLEEGDEVEVLRKGKNIVITKVKGDK